MISKSGLQQHPSQLQDLLFMAVAPGQQLRPTLRPAPQGPLVGFMAGLHLLEVKAGQLGAVQQPREILQAYQCTYASTSLLQQPVRSM